MQNIKLQRKLKILSIFPIIISIFLCMPVAIAQEWQELKSEHFIVYFTQDKNFAQDVLNKSEVYYQRIAADLGYARYSNFWTWDNRVKIYIHPDHASFIKATGQPQWSQGMADYRYKQIVSFVWSKGFLESLLPHEMAHLIFRDFVGFKGEVPVWLDEGVAQWAEAPKRGYIKAMSKQLYQRDTIIPLSDMIKLDIRKITDKDRIYIHSTRTKDGEGGILFLGGEDLINVYYLQAVSLVGFLIESYGALSFADFCRQLRDGRTLGDALRIAYPMHITSVEELETKWREYLGKQGG